MGTCLSKKKESSSSLNVSVPAPLEAAKPVAVRAAKKGCESDETRIKKNIVHEEEVPKKDVEEEESVVKKEVFVIKHRKSHEKRGTAPVASPNPPEVVETEVAAASGGGIASGGEMGSGNVNGNAVVRTSSCTKEEVDAILIQCGRLSRSNSSEAGKAVLSSGRKYSGSKRSYDFDHNEQENQVIEITNSADSNPRRKGNCEEDDATAGVDKRQHRQRHRESGRSSPSPKGRRRTPSREREQQQRSGSRERGGGNGSRRVSRSPGRRSENNPTTTSNNSTSNGNNNVTNSGTRPAKMVSVPATVSSLVMDKSNNGVEPQTANGVKRINVKRNVGEAAAGSRGAASPRAKSPARTNGESGNQPPRTRSPARTIGYNESSNQQQQPQSLSRSSSRKADQSPYRRNPLSEIDPNSLAYPPASGNKVSGINNNKKPSGETNNKVSAQGTNSRGSNMDNKVTKEQQQLIEDEPKGQQPTNASIGKNTIITPVAETLKPPQQTLTRSRSGRRSRDLDFNPETLLNPTPSYTTLLLEDIHNFHQKNTTTAPSFTLPPCVTKACSIVEAVADLNSTTSSNISCAFADDRRSPPPVAAASLVGKKSIDAKDPFVETEVGVSDDLMEPSFHRYVTVRRGGMLCGEDMDGQESSGSNSYVGGGSQQNWGGYSTSSWEPNSADSTDRWTSRSNTREEDRVTSSEGGGHELEEARRGFSGQRTGGGVGRGRVGSTGRNLHGSPMVVAATAATQVK